MLEFQRRFTGLNINTWNCIRKKGNLILSVMPAKSEYYKLYDWIFNQFAKEGQMVLDTHLGSGSSRIAAHKHKLNFVGCEIDTEYFVGQDERFKEFVSQLRLF